MRLLKNLLIKKLSKEKTNGAKIWQEKPNENEIQKKYRKQKQISIKKIKTKLERLKNQGGIQNHF